MCRPSLWTPRLVRRCIQVSGLLLTIGLGACGDILDVTFPGRVPIEQADDPTLAPVLAKSAIGDLECAYDNYVLAAAVHSDEYEGSLVNANVVAWSHRSLSPDLLEYVSGPCEAGTGGTPGGLHTPMQTARFWAEDVFRRLEGWTDAEVANRNVLMATVRAYSAFPYVFFGETYCSIAFDRGPIQQPVAALQIAEQRFAEAISLAQAAGATDILNLTRAGMARVKMDLKKWSEAESFATLVPVGYRKNADRGTEIDRRYNRVYLAGIQVGAYVVAEPYRTMSDPRVMVADAGRDAGFAGIRLWVTTKYPALGSPIRIVSYEEAQLIKAEARAEQADVAGAMTILNTRRATLGLSALSAANQAEAVSRVISERQRELSFEGGHRLNDLLRKGISWKNGLSPFLRRPYGTVTCWPLPPQEQNGA